MKIISEWKGGENQLQHCERYKVVQGSKENITVTTMPEREVSGWTVYFRIKTQQLNPPEIRSGIQSLPH